MNYRTFKNRVYVTIKRWQELKEVSANIAKKEGKSRALVFIDAFVSLFRYGTIYTEYQALNFYNRTSKNRKTFITVLWLVEQLDKYNPHEYRYFFHDKRLFNETFSEYLNRRWMAIDTVNDELLTLLGGVGLYLRKPLVVQESRCMFQPLRIQ